MCLRHRMYEDREVSSNVQMGWQRAEDREGERGQGGLGWPCSYREPGEDVRLDRGCVSFVSYGELNAGPWRSLEQVSISWQ